MRHRERTSFIEILREEIHALDDDELVHEAHRLLHSGPRLDPRLAQLIGRLVADAERDLGRRFRGRLRADARGRLRTFCLNVRVNAG